MVDVFVSYASEDRDRVTPLVEAIEAEGLEVWWNQHIHAGPSFRNAIEAAMASARCMLVVWSEASIKSDFVIDEATTGRERGILVPVQIEDVQVPLGSWAAQTAQLQNWPGDRTGLEPLLAGIHDTLTGRSSPARVHASSRSARWRLPAAIGAAVLAAAAYFSLMPANEPVAARSIAVLPLKNTAGVSESSFLVDGLHEGLIANPSKVSSLRVTSPTSVRRVNSELPIPEIGTVLGVANVRGSAA
jgi:serine/threonine-protein kinase